MKTLFYPKLAVNGMKKNKRLYLPYILTLVAMVMMLYITAYLARSENIANTNRGVYAQWCLWLGIIVIIAVSQAAHNSFHDRVTGKLTDRGLAWQRRVIPPPDAPPPF